MTNGNVLVWAKMVEAQRAQAAAMSAITETKEFNKIKVSRPAWASNPETPAEYNTPHDWHVDTVAVQHTAKMHGV